MRKLRIARLHNATLSQTLIFPCGLGKHCTSTEYVQMLPVTVNYYQFAYHYNCIKCCKSQEDRSRIIQEQVQGLSANTMPCYLRELGCWGCLVSGGNLQSFPLSITVSICTHMYARLSTHPPQGDGPKEHSDPAVLRFQETIIFSWPQFLRTFVLKMSEVAPCQV